MENDDVVRRCDGSVIVGLTGAEWEEYLNSYTYVSEEELIHFRDSLDRGRSFDKYSFERSASSLNGQREYENKNGKQASLATSLFMLLSVHVKPRKSSSSSSLSVFGEISTVSSYYSNKKDYIYKRESQDVETLSGSDGGGYLTINGPSDSCCGQEACFYLQSRKLSIRLYDQRGQRLYPLDDNDDDQIILDYSPHEFEHVKDKVVQNTEISLTFKYVSIPMALCGYLDIKISKMEGYTDLSKFVDVCGKVVAKYKNTFGNYESEDIVIFDKDPRFNQYERVCLNMNLLSLSRCWVAAPAYSLLRLHIELFDSGKNPILTKDVELETDNSYGSSKEFISGEYLISVCSVWRGTSRLPKQDSCDDQISRSLEQYTLHLESAIEVFSVLVCYEECMPFQIHGRLQFNTFFASDDFIDTGFDIFKRENDDPLTLLGRGDAIPLLNGGSRVITHLPLSTACDLKDTIRGLNIKGHRIIRDREDYCYGRQLCSVFRGDHGFAALHFAIFKSAVQAHLNVFVYQRKGSQCAVFGSICARYKDFDYSSQYKKNWYSIIIFKKGREDLVQIDADGLIPLGREDLMQIDGDGSTPLGREDLVQMDANGSIPLSRFSIPLSRSSFVVPPYSSTMFDLDLMIGTQKFTREINVAIDTPTMSIKGEECEVEFVLEWSEVWTWKVNSLLVCLLFGTYTWKRSYTKETFTIDKMIISTWLMDDYFQTINHRNSHNYGCDPGHN